MFFVNANNFTEMIELLGYPVSRYDVVVSPYGKHYNRITSMSGSEEHHTQVLLAEMAFQMNWKQEPGNVCPECKDNGQDVCGHLVFTL